MATWPNCRCWASRNRIPDRWLQPERTRYPLDQSYVELFEAQVAGIRSASRPVALTGVRALSSERAQQPSGSCPDCGRRGSDHPVALLAERGLELLGMIIGSFKAGQVTCRWTRRCRATSDRIIDLSRTPLLVCTEDCREQAQACSTTGLRGRPQLLVWE